ncbi:MAG: DNA-processing protein DprA [Clostridia bacterium]|nr:DNA-processing protein DprA [Clostridia bacterium]
MEDIYWIWLSRIQEIGPITWIKLLKKYKTPKQIWETSKEDFIQAGFSSKIACALTNEEYRKNLDKYIEYIKKNNIKILKIYDSFYPNKLRQIYAPPIILFAKGNLEILNELSIAIVGCRYSSSYGEKVAKQFAYKLSSKNINIISGLARGIDTCAHLGCMQSKGKTIAVMGSGLDIIYPPENKNIYNQIINNGGVVLSEYIIGTKPLPENFPRRNRIISGLSDGVLVIEAKEKSGTLITVDFALEQGKEVYVVPGNIDSINSYGTNSLIKQGAQLITNENDILENMKYIVK